MVEIKRRNKQTWDAVRVRVTPHDGCDPQFAPKRGSVGIARRPHPHVAPSDGCFLSTSVKPTSQRGRGAESATATQRTAGGRVLQRCFAGGTHVVGVCAPKGVTW